MLARVPKPIIKCVWQSKTTLYKNLLKSGLLDLFLAFKRREIVHTNYKSPDYAYSPPQQVQNVTWNDTLAANAENWANYLATNNLFEHAKNIWEGENLYLSGSPLPTEPCTEATQLFYREIDNYDFSKPGFSLKTGHFTQVFFHNFFNATDSLFVIHVEVTRFYPHSPRLINDKNFSFLFIHQAYGQF